jgi:hypothetical protein
MCESNALLRMGWRKSAYRSQVVQRLRSELCTKADVELLQRMTVLAVEGRELTPRDACCRAHGSRGAGLYLTKRMAASVRLTQAERSSVTRLVQCFAKCLMALSSI